MTWWLTGSAPRPLDLDLTADSGPYRFKLINLIGAVKRRSDGAGKRGLTKVARSPEMGRTMAARRQPRTVSTTGWFPGCTGGGRGCGSTRASRWCARSSRRWSLPAAVGCSWSSAEFGLRRARAQRSAAQKNRTRSSGCVQGREEERRKGFGRKGSPSWSGFEKMAAAELHSDE